MTSAGSWTSCTRSFGEHGVPRAVEDLPPDSRDKLPGLASAPEKHPLWQRILDELADVGLDSYGDLETVPLLHFLSQYPVTAYTYPVSPELSRGERPSLAKLRDLAGQGYQRTVNLCAETVGGDTPLITMAGLAGPLDTVHLPIVDMHNPTPGRWCSCWTCSPRPALRAPTCTARRAVAGPG